MGGGAMGTDYRISYPHKEKAKDGINRRQKSINTTGTPNKFKHNGVFIRADKHRLLKY